MRSLYRKMAFFFLFTEVTLAYEQEWHYKTTITIFSLVSENFLLTFGRLWREITAVL